MKKAMIISMALYLLYAVFDYFRYTHFGIATSAGEWAGCQIFIAIWGSIFWYVCVPMFIFKTVRKIFFSAPVLATASVAAPQQLDWEEDSSG